MTTDMGCLLKCVMSKISPYPLVSAPFGNAGHLVIMCQNIVENIQYMYKIQCCIRNTHNDIIGNIWAQSWLLKLCWVFSAVRNHCWVVSLIYIMMWCMLWLFFILADQIFMGVAYFVHNFIYIILQSVTKPERDWCFLTGANHQICHRNVPEK